MHAEPEPRTFQPDIYEKVLGFLPDRGEGEVLDLGAGQGYLSRRLKDIGYAVRACDIDSENFRCPDIPFTNANLNDRFPFPDNYFKCVVSIEVIEHMENHFRFMEEAFRVTKPGGLIIITTPNIMSFPSRLHFLLYGFTDCAPVPIDPKKPDYYMEHINPISLPELLLHIERNGGELVSLTANRIRLSAWLPMLLLYPLMASALRIKLLRKKHRSSRDRHRHYIKWMLKPANLMGRISIIVARKTNRFPVSTR